MTQHKAPTQISIAPLTEKSAFEQFISKYWMPAAAIAIGIAAAIVYSEFAAEQEKATVAEHWDTLRSRVELDTIGSGDLPASADLKVLADELEATPAGPWARALEVQSAIKANEFEEADAAIQKLSSDYSDHPVLGKTFVFGDEEDTTEETIAARLERVSASRSAWSSEHTGLFDPPEVAEDAPRVSLVTDFGTIVIGLYPEYAPKHVENFLKHCRAGYYDGVKFHRVLANQLIQGGDPNSIEGDPATWGTGGPDYTIEPEVSVAWHFKGMLAAARNPAEVESSGSQFYITAAPQHHYDKQYTVYGRVLEGIEVVEAIAAQVPAGADRPENPAVIEETIVAE